MTLNDYQEKAVSTAVYGAGQKIVYPILGLNGEAGEVANTYKKVLRSNNGVLLPYMRDKLIDELSDCLWYLAACAQDLDTNLDFIAEYNLMKLEKRRRNNELLEHRDE